MIKDKLFSSKEKLNDFVNENNINVISIETVLVDTISDLLLPRGGYFHYDEEHYKLWFKE